MQRHPLINKDSRHYDSKDKSAIELMEEKYTMIQMYHWATITYDKYDYRKDAKGQKKSDLVKMSTYKAYANFLERILDSADINMLSLYAKDAYRKIGLEIKYSNDL